VKLIIFLLPLFCDISALAGPIPQPRFLGVANEIRRVYEPLARKDNTTFKIIWKLNEGVINASGIKRNGSWELTVYGGLMFHPFMTEEAFRFILCHEMGHILGGEPTFPVSPIDRTSNSGQPDYYAAAVCMKLLLKDADNTHQNAVDPVVEVRCRHTFNTPREQNLCRRVGNAGNEAARFLSTILGQKASYSTPSREVANHMESAHPVLQCRMDTYLAGALCRTMPSGISVDEGNQINASCNVGESARPRCWFVPQAETAVKQEFTLQYPVKIENRANRMELRKPLTIGYQGK
jgi:hypothetical protein